MSARQLAPDEIGLPRFVPAGESAGEVFAFTSHQRAREALAFGLSIDEPGFNIFVVGEDRSGRMSATLDFLRGAVAERPRPDDWVYLNNFRRPHRPRPYRLPAGAGRRFRDRMAALVPQMRNALAAALSDEANQSRIRSEGDRLRAEIGRRLEALRQEARGAGLDIAQTPQGLSVVRSDEAGSQAGSEEAAAAIVAKLAELNRWAAREQAQAAEQVRAITREIAGIAIGPLVQATADAFAEHPALVQWLQEMRADLLEDLERFLPRDSETPGGAPPERRYAVNLLVDHADHAHPAVVLEPNPTYENLFGTIEYRRVGSAFETDFTLIRAGALHRANGGILVLRADAIAEQGLVWRFLKGALRDRAIRIEELHRSGGVPLAGAPQPEAIPLEVKVVLVGAPRWYYGFFSADPEFQTYFKIKADIDADMPANRANLDTYAALIGRMAAAHDGAFCDPAAIVRLLGVASRWAGDRRKLTARFELIEDVIAEAVRIARQAPPACIRDEDVIAARAGRRERNDRVEDRMQEGIREGAVLIDTRGAAVGQVNALVIRDLGDYAFGLPSRVTARVSAGRLGVVNIEREALLGGPIQQKAAMVLQGFLAGHFARRLPLSFTASITFEQSYGGVEGDSASLAELIAILSDLSGLPARQDLAITGSANQRGQAQAVGGVHLKVEGFFRTCKEAGLTGTQGVVVPAANEPNLLLEDEVVEAVRAGRFSLYSVRHLDEALELFLGAPAGTPDAEDRYPPDSVYGRAMAQLEAFDRIIAARERLV